jgi:hypothetical protein
MTQFLEPESLYFKCLSYSGLLLTTALLFYHMTKSKTLEMNRSLSGSFAVLLIFTSIIYLILGSYSYFQRLQNLLRQNKENIYSKKVIKNEIFIYYFYFSLGIIILLVEFAICITILNGIFFY